MTFSNDVLRELLAQVNEQNAALEAQNAAASENKTLARELRKAERTKAKLTRAEQRVQKNKDRCRVYYENNRGRLQTLAVENAAKAKVRKMQHLIDCYGKPHHCNICNRAIELGGTLKDSACWDHDHQLEHLCEAYQFRGWLCGPCNKAIGLLGDCSEMLQKATNYLREHERRRTVLIEELKAA